MTTITFEPASVPTVPANVIFYDIPPPTLAPACAQDVASGWSIATEIDLVGDFDWSNSVQRAGAVGCTFADADSLTGSLAIAWQYFASQGAGSGIAWADMQLLMSAINSLDWIVMSPRDRSTALAWAVAAELAEAATDIEWSQPSLTNQLSTGRSTIWADAESQLGVSTDLEMGSTQPVGMSQTLIWGRGTQVIRPVIPTWPSDPVLPPDWPEMLPQQSTYMIVPSISVIRLPDLTPIACLIAEVSIDRGSWAWTINLTPASAQAFSLLDPTANGVQTVQITINGFVIVGIIESYGRQRGADKSAWSFAGRSSSAQLAAPFAIPRTYTNDSTASAAQLATAELEGSGWAMDWQVVDWTIQAGQFSYQNLTPIEAISLLAAAAGAVVQSDHASQTLHVVSKYPVSPRAWSTATPAAVIPKSIMTRPLTGQYSPAPTYDYVYCTGGTQGVNVEGTRSGTGGTNPRPDSVVDALLTAVEVGQERARVELDSSGDIITTTGVLPIISPIGVPLPTQLVQVQEDSTYMAQVTATRIKADRSNGPLTVAMALTLERRP